MHIYFMLVSNFKLVSIDGTNRLYSLWHLDYYYVSVRHDNLIKVYLHVLGILAFHIDHASLDLICTYWQKRGEKNRQKCKCKKKKKRNPEKKRLFELFIYS